MAISTPLTTVSRSDGSPLTMASRSDGSPSSQETTSTLDKLPKILASSNKRTRQRGIEALSKWLSSRELSEGDLKRVWKGLFYAVWHADKAPVQEELIERVAGLLLSLGGESARRFLEIFLWTMRREWSGIDRLRLDKFYLLLRTFLHTTLEYMQRGHWEPHLVARFMEVYTMGTLEAKDKHAALGINLHLADTFVEEASRFSVPPTAAPLLLEPFLRILAHSGDKSLVPRVESAVFGTLVDDWSAENAGSSIAKALDFDQLASRLFALASAPETPPKNRAVLYAVHARLKRQGAETMTQNGGKDDEAEPVTEEAPLKDNGKRTAAVENGKGRKKQRLEIVKFGEVLGMEADGAKPEEKDKKGEAKATRIEEFLEQAADRGIIEKVANGSKGEGKAKAKKGERKATRNRENLVGLAGVKQVADTGHLEEATNGVQKKGKKKGRKVDTEAKGLVTEERDGLGGQGISGTRSGGLETGEKAGGERSQVQRRSARSKGGISNEAVGAGEIQGVSVEDGERVVKQGRRVGKRKTIEALDGAETSAKEGPLQVEVGKNGDRNTQKGGPGEVETDPLEGVPLKRKKGSKAAVKRAVMEEEGAVVDAEPLKAKQGEAKSRKKAGESGAVVDDVAADVSRPAEAKPSRKGRLGKGGNISKADAIAAIEGALDELRGAGGSPAVVEAGAPAVMQAGAPAVVQGKGKKKRLKGSVITASGGGVDFASGRGLDFAAGGGVAVPGTPKGEVEFEGSLRVGDGEDDSAAKRRKSGAGATPAFAPKSATAANGVQTGGIGKSRFGPNPGGANLATRFAEADIPIEGRFRNRRQQLGDAMLGAQNPEGGFSPIAVTPSPLNGRAATRGNPSKGGVLESRGSRKKKVRFSLKNNLEFKVGSPLPEKTTRTPPAATPRGSALKVTGPSPIRRRGMSLVDGYVIGSRRNKKDRRSPALIHISGVRGGNQRGGRARRNGPERGGGRGRRIMLVR